MKRFELGKAYEHPSGEQIFVCGIADTILNGICLIAEQGWNQKKKSNNYFDHGWELKLVSFEKGAFENWYEISKDEFIENNFS